jgi:D-glycero-D-manno-heptose 1,7-bisphosphate phosphatase
MNESRNTRTTRRAIFIDRDGTLNEEVGYIRELGQFRLYDYATEAVRLINQAGWLAIIITNQSGIARGLFTEELLAEVHQKMIAELEQAGAGVDAIYFCPHHPNLGEPPFRLDCDCRKPKPGLLERAAVEFQLTLSDCVVIGDRFRDIETAQAVGARGVLVLTGYGREELETPPGVRPDHIAANLLEAVRWVINES